MKPRGIHDFLFHFSNRLILWASKRGLGRRGALGGTFLLRKLWPPIDGFLFRRLHPSVTEVLGQTMFLDRDDSLWLSRNGVHEPLETRLVTGLIRPGDVAIDAGAHIGYYTLLLARLVGPTGRVAAFEPDPENMRLLAANVEANGHRNVTLEAPALSDRAERVTLHRDPSGSGDHRIYPAAERRAGLSVETIRLDDYLASHGLQPDFIKLDIQGAEMAALLGMEQTLKGGASLAMLVEFWPGGLRTAGREPHDLLRLLQGTGFRIEVIDTQRESVENLEPGTLLERLDGPGGVTQVNLLCRRP